MKQTLIQLTFCTLIVSPVFANDQETSTAIKSNDYFASLAHLNTSTPLEDAGSHGSIGYSIGVGASQTRLNAASDVYHEQGITSEEDSDEVTAPKVFFTKGLFNPLDIGVSVARMPSGKAFQYSGYLQWTAYQAFQMPALAIRATHTQLQGLHSSDITTNRVEAIASYGVFGFLVGYLGAGVARHEASYVRENTTSEFALESEVRPEEYQFQSQQTTQFAGIRLMIPPTFMNAAVEVQRNEGQADQYTAKLAYSL